ncbi:hypothetical protein K504DRAFT_376734, partial [Pleomassaria siparia CBS 279.74]
TAVVFGCTGDVGSHILTTLLSDPTFPSVKTIFRNLPSSPLAASKTHGKTTTTYASSMPKLQRTLMSRIMRVFVICSLRR